MSNVYSLAKLREDIEKKYEPISIELSDGSEVVLNNLLRLGSKARKEVVALLKSSKPETEGDEPEVDDEDTLTRMQKVIVLIARDTPKGKQLVKELGDDLTLTSEVVTMWSEATQPGEASKSLD
jgi:hypothetical protein